MKVLAITSNPKTDSLTNAVADAFLNGATASGAEAELLDLHRIGFNPVYTNEDREHYLGRAPFPSDVVPLQAQIADSDVIAVVFPIYWYAMPAMMKGFFERVLCRGFAYRRDGLPGALVGKTVRIFVLCGDSEEWYRTSGMDDALQLQICERTFKHYCRVDDVELHYVDGLIMGDDSHEAIESANAQLRQIRIMGETITASHSS
ncbi:NAD(P)H-dependent oxidoreductase [Bifidobacterium aquikefiricola]|uniref:NAD(P)H-dependent oxidoreductase n=1 Tax=Bifidobacterium aquikefiricola TaxID=3059038 RepID=A0AB39U4K3_9BIFI